MAKAKGEPTKVLCARVKPDIYEPIYKIRDRDGVKVSDLIREGLRKEISARSPFEKQAIQELTQANSPQEVSDIAEALIEAAETPKEEKFVEKAATAALNAVVLTAPKYRNFEEEVLTELRKAKTLDQYRAKYNELFKEAKRLGTKATQAFYRSQRIARDELNAALKLAKAQEKELAKTKKKLEKASKPKPAKKAPAKKKSPEPKPKSGAVSPPKKVPAERIPRIRKSKEEQDKRQKKSPLKR